MLWRLGVVGVDGGGSAVAVRGGCCICSVVAGWGCAAVGVGDISVGDVSVGDSSVGDSGVRVAGVDVTGS